MTKTNKEKRSYEVEGSRNLNALLTTLPKKEHIQGVGFDIFCTILAGSMPRLALTTFLSNQIAEYFSSQMDMNLTQAVVQESYYESREALKAKRSHIKTEKGGIAPIEQECSETKVFEAIGKIFKVTDLSNFILNMQRAWLQYDLENTYVIDGMDKTIAKSIEIFGREQVAFFSNHSCSHKHILSLMHHHGLIKNKMVYPKNLFLSNSFELSQFGVGLRKPNQIAFRHLSSNLKLKPKNMAFVGDSKKDVLFATNSGGVGILFSEVEK